MKKLTVIQKADEDMSEKEMKTDEIMKTDEMGQKSNPKRPN